jgi:hypothetical protein
MHGSRARLVANGYDLSPFMRDASVEMTADTSDASTWANDDGSQRTDKKYVAGLRDAAFSGSAILDMDTNEAHAGIDAGRVFELALAGDVIMVHMPQGGSFGAVARLMQALSSGINVSTPYSDVGALDISAVTRESLRGIVLNDHTVVVSATGDGASYDAGAAGMPTEFGAVGQLHVIEKGGGAGTLTVVIQHSADDTIWADLVTFTGQTTGNVSERIEVAGNVERYIRAIRTVTGGTWKFHASLARNLA